MIFKDIDKIRYMGPDNRDPLAFSFYDPEEEVFGVK